MRASTLIGYSIGLMDLTALAALAATGEIQNFIFAALAFAFVLSRFRRDLLNNAVLVAFLILTILSAVGAWLIFKTPLILGVAHAAPIAHGLLWLGNQTNRERSWRIALGFVELNLAAVITAEFYLAPAVFIFTLLATLAISGNYLEASIRKTQLSNTPVLLPRSFLLSTLGLSFLILLTSFLIFPILPRVRSLNDQDTARKEVGYTENVSLSSLRAFRTSGLGSVALTFFLPSNLNLQEILSEYFPLGLIRGRALSIFDGNSWKSEPKKSRSPSFQNPYPEKEINLEATREPLGTPALPVPYGATRVWVQPSGTNLSMDSVQLSSGEWVNHDSQNQKISYSFKLRSDNTPSLGSFTWDKPNASHLQIPTALNTPRMNQLAQRLFSDRMSPPEKVAAIRNYFSQERFSFSLETEAPDLNQKISRSFHPLEHFLFLTQKGHCELFASSAAILLRMSGVPTRIVAGFRISRKPLQGVLSVRMTDSHAWAEYWVPEHGWMTLDLTPRLLTGNSALDLLQQIYELGSALWYRHILSFDYRYQLKAVHQGLQSIDRALLLRTLLFFILGIACWSLIRRRNQDPCPRWIRKERVAMEQLLARKLYGKKFFHFPVELDFTEAQFRVERQFGKNSAQLFSSWHETYLRVRFGKPASAHKADINKWTKMRKAFEKTLI